MRLFWAALLLPCSFFLHVSDCGAQSIAALAPDVDAVLQVANPLNQLRALQGQRSDSPSTMLLRQQVLERVLHALLDVDTTLGRIDREASYTSEDRYTLQVRAQRASNALNVFTFAAGGTLGTAGNAMQLTNGLNHAGVALSAASSGTTLILSAVQLRGLNGGKRLIRSPYNMLAPVLDRHPNAQSTYSPLVTAYLKHPQPDGGSLGLNLVQAWTRLDRLKSGKKSKGSDPELLTADRDSGLAANADEFANREAMLHDLSAEIMLVKQDLQEILLYLDGLSR